jgi:hypothetical protein
MSEAPTGAEVLGMLALLVLALGFAGSKVLGVQPPLSFETTVVLMLLNHATVVSGGA